MKEPNKPDADRYIVPGLKRGLEMLQLFDADCPSMRLTTLAQRLGISRSSAFRLVHTLESMGMVERDPASSSFRLGSCVLSLGFANLSALELVEVASPELQALRHETGFSAHLAILDTREIVYLARMPSHSGLTSNIAVGQRRDAHAAPLGRVLLSELSDDELTDLYKGVRLQPRTPMTPTTLDDLRRSLAEVRARGYEVSRGSYWPGGCSVAAPVRDSSGEIIAGISITGPYDEAAEARLATEFRDSVLAAAGRISARLGHRDRLGGSHDNDG